MIGIDWELFYFNITRQKKHVINRNLKQLPALQLTAPKLRTSHQNSSKCKNKHIRQGMERRKDMGKFQNEQD